MVGPNATHAVDVTSTIDLAAASLAAHRRYLEVLSEEPVESQVRAIIDMATSPKEGFPAARAVGFELYHFGG